MATRPIGNPPIWAQDTNFPAGADPWSGNACKVTAPTAEDFGFTPETGSVAQYHNAEFNVLSTWVEWLSFGSNAAGEDAHVVETDSTGVARIAGMVLGGTAGAFTPLVLTANSGATGTTINATNNSGGFAITATSNGVLAALRATSTGASAAVEGLNTGGGGPGTTGSGNGAGAGIVGTGGATGDGGTFVAGVTGGHGMHGTCTASGNSGAFGLASATVDGTFGVRGVTQRSNQVGVSGENLIAGANPLLGTQAAVLGLADDGTAVFGASADGYGVWAQSSGTTRASLHIEPQVSDPIAPLLGDVWYNSVEGKLKSRINSFNMGIWATRRGYAYAYAENPALISTASQTFQAVATSTFTTQTEPFASAILTFTVAFEMGCSVIALAAASEFEWQVLDVTDGTATPIAPRLESSHIVSATTADERYVTAKVQYTVPATGPRTFELQFRSINSIPVVRIRRAVMEITGSHG